MNFKVSGRIIILAPKDVIVEGKYSPGDLESSEEVLSKGLGGERVSFKSGRDAVRYFKKITKKK